MNLKIFLIALVILCSVNICIAQGSDFTMSEPSTSEGVFTFDHADETISWTVKGLSVRNAGFTEITGYKNNKAALTNGFYIDAFQGINANIETVERSFSYKQIVSFDKSQLPADYEFLTINEVYGTSKDSTNYYMDINTGEKIAWTDKNTIKEITTRQVFFGDNDVRFIRPVAYDDDFNFIEGYYEVKYNSPGSIELFTVFKKSDVDTLSGIIYLDPGFETWVSDSSIVSGLSDVGDNSAPTVFNDSGTLKLISGEYDGGFHGFYWNGSSWVSDSGIVDGLGDIGRYSTPTVYNDSGTWKLISGEFDGGFHGFYWNGSSWVSDSGIVDGLGDIGESSTPTVFLDGSTWKLISGEYHAVVNGYYWSGSVWVSNSDIVSGLGSASSNFAPTVYNDSGTRKLIAGDAYGDFDGYYWSGSAWVSNSDIVSGLGEGYGVKPTVYDDNGMLKLIHGFNDGTFYGFYLNAPPTIPTNQNDLGNNLIDHTPTITWTEGTDAEGNTVTTYVYVGTTSTPTTLEGSTTAETFDLGTNTTFTDGNTYYYRLRSWDGGLWSDYTTADEFRMNSKPSITGTTISPVPATELDDLTAGNDTVTDAEGDAITLHYSWYKDSVLQTTLNDMVTVNQSYTATDEVWKVGIIPNDGYENGTEIQSSTTTIGSSNVAPTLTGIASNQTTWKYNQSVTISTLNATDGNSDNYVLYIGTATGLSDLCTSVSTPNGTQANCSFAIPWTSGSHTIYGRLYDGNDTSIEYTEIITVDVTPPVIGTTSVSSSSGLADFPFSITADVTVANGSVSWVYACVSKLGDACTNYSLSHSGGSLYTGVYTDTTAAGNYYVTYYSSDDSGNIAYKSTPDSITLAPSEGQGGTGGVTINETIIEIGDLTLTPPRLDTYFFLTSFDGPQTAEYTFFANRKVESCSIEPNDLTTCEIEEGFIIKARMIVNGSTESYIGKLTVVDESGYTASVDIIVRVIDLGSSIPIAEIPVGGLIADVLSLFFVSSDGVLVAIRIWAVAGLFGGLIIAVWYSM